MTNPKKRIQCKACPWRKDVVPERDIPGGYSEEKHCNLKSTISDGGIPTSLDISMMACHESKPGREIVCVGWLHNQLGVGNNIPLRILALDGNLPKYELVGPQHQRFEDTLPKPSRKRR